jgi:hypothetical protein
VGDVARRVARRIRAWAARLLSMESSSLLLEPAGGPESAGGPENAGLGEATHTTHKNPYPNAR